MAHGLNWGSPATTTRRRRSLQAASSPFTRKHFNFPSHVLYISAVPEILGRSVGLFLGPGTFHQCSSHPCRYGSLFVSTGVNRGHSPLYCGLLQPLSEVSTARAAHVAAISENGQDTRWGGSPLHKDCIVRGSFVSLQCEPRGRLPIVSAAFANSVGAKAIRSPLTFSFPFFMPRRRHFSVHIAKPTGGKVQKSRNLPMKETSRGRIESKWWENTKSSLILS